MKRFTLIVILLSTTYVYANQPLVRAIYLTPSDMGVPLEAEMKAKANILLNTQRFYAKEMNRHGYGYKTFNLETDGDGKVIFHNIKGKKTLRQYGDINLIVDEVNNALGEGFNDENGLRVVYVAGAEKIAGGAFNANWCKTWRDNANNVVDEFCANYPIIPANRNTLSSFLTAHEMGHAFGLEHNQDGKDFVMVASVDDNPSYDLDITFLSPEEVRWLDKNRYFNNRRHIKAFPIVTKAEKFELRTGYIRIVFDVKNKNRIHQSFLKCVSRNEAVGWGTLSAGTFTIEFNVHRKMFLKSDKVQLHTMDVEGNQFFNELTINLNDAPAAPSNLKVKTIVIWAELKKTDSKQVDN